MRGRTLPPEAAYKPPGAFLQTKTRPGPSNQHKAPKHDGTESHTCQETHVCVDKEKSLRSRSQACPKAPQGWKGYVCVVAEPPWPPRLATHLPGRPGSCRAHATAPARLPSAWPGRTERQREKLVNGLSVCSQTATSTCTARNTYL